MAHTLGFPTDAPPSRRWILAPLAAIALLCCAGAATAAWSGFGTRHLSLEQARAELLDRQQTDTRRKAAAEQLRRIACQAIDALREAEDVPHAKASLKSLGTR